MNSSSVSGHVSLVVFDLDGTLVDSREDICASIEKTLAHMGVAALPTAAVAPLIGIPLRDIFSRLLGTSDDDAIEAACAFYRNWYFDHCAVRTRPFRGVLPCLETLARAGVKRAVATGKMQFQAEKVLRDLDMSRHFDLVLGSDGLPYKPAPAILIRILETLSVAPERSWMVGDTTLDILAGKAAGMRTCAVTCGTDSRAILESTAPDLLLDHLTGFPGRIGVPAGPSAGGSR